MATNIYEKFGKIVREWRLEKNLTQERLAFDSGISVTYMSKIETGAVNVSLGTICKLARGLKIEVRDLLQDL